MLWFVNPGKKRRRAKARKNPRRVSRGHRLEGGYAVPEWHAKPRSKARTTRRVKVQHDVGRSGRTKSVRYYAVNPSSWRKKKGPRLSGAAKTSYERKRRKRWASITAKRVHAKARRVKARRGRDSAELRYEDTRYGAGYRGNPRKKRGKSMAKRKRKLYGAALAARMKKRAKGRRRAAARRHHGGSARHAVPKRRKRRAAARRTARKYYKKNPGRAKLNRKQVAKWARAYKKTHGRAPSRDVLAFLRTSQKTFKYRRNPANYNTAAYRSGYDRIFGKKKAAAKRPKKRRSAAPGARHHVKRRRTKRAASGVTTARIREMYAAGGVGAPKKKRKKSTAAKRRKKSRGGSTMAKKRKKSRKGKSSKRSAAARKGARTRKRNKAMRAAAARRGRGRRKGHRKGGRRSYKRRARRTGVRSLQRARRIIRRKGRKRWTRARRFITRHRMRSNPSFKGMIDVVKQALPVAGAFYAGRILANKVTAIPAVGGLVGRLGVHAAPAMAAATLFGGTMLAAKVRPLARYSGAIATGLGLNLVFTLIDAYMPASVKGLIGVGDDGLYDEALADYENVGDYENVEGYENINEGALGGFEGGGLIGDGGAGVGGGIFANTGWAG
jgi:hypothetical protein